MEVEIKEKVDSEMSFDPETMTLISLINSEEEEEEGDVSLQSPEEDIKDP